MKHPLIYLSFALFLTGAATAAPTGSMVYPVNPPIMASPEQKVTIRRFEPEMPLLPADRLSAAMSCLTKAEEYLSANRKIPATLLLVQALDQLTQLKNDHPAFQSANLGYQIRKTAELYAKTLAPDSRK